MRWIAIFVLPDPLAVPAVSSDAPKPGYGKNQTRDDLEQKASAEQISLCELTWEASRYFERSELDQATRCYEQILLAFPDDPAAKVLLATYSTNVPVKGIGPIQVQRPVSRESTCPIRRGQIADDIPQCQQSCHFEYAGSPNAMTRQFHSAVLGWRLL